MWIISTVITLSVPVLNVRCFLILPFKKHSNSVGLSAVCVCVCSNILMLSNLDKRLELGDVHAVMSVELKEMSTAKFFDLVRPSRKVSCHNTQTWRPVFMFV